MSDSGCVDNAVEFLVMAGKRSLPEVGLLCFELVVKDLCLIVKKNERLYTTLDLKSATI